MNTLPTVPDLVALAIRETDFLGDLPRDGDPHDLFACAANSAEHAAELWEEARGFPVNATIPLDLIIQVREALVAHGNDVIRDREQDRVDALREGQMAGDLDRNGNVIPYSRYP